MDSTEYWRTGRGLSHITPPSNRMPESKEFFKLLQELLFGQDMVDFGCGVGRLAPFFSKQRYRGVDICTAAIDIARKDHHGYQFDVIDEESPIEGSFALLAHTVVLHIPDSQLQQTIGRFTQRHVIVSEIMGKKWRRPHTDGLPDVFNRELPHYDAAFKTAGYKMVRVMWAEYPHYRDTDIAIMEFHKERSDPK